MPELPRRQVTAPVRFTDLVLRLGELGVRAVLEVGPGRVLSGLVRRIDRDLVRGALGGASELMIGRKGRSHSSETGVHDRPKHALSSAADFVYQNGG